MSKLYLIILLNFTLSLYSKITIFTPKAPPSIPILHGDFQNFDIELYDRFNTAVLPKLVKGDEGIYIIPTNVAAKLFNKGVDIVLLASLSDGLLSFCSKGDLPLTRIKDREIYLPAKGSSPDVITKLIVDDTQNLKFKYSSSPEIAKLMKAGRVDYAVLPQPLASKVVVDGYKLFDMRDDWKAITGVSSIPQVSLVVTKNLMISREDQIDQFVDSLKKEIDLVNSGNINIDRLDKLGWSKELILSSIPMSNLVYNSDKGSINLYLSKLLKDNPKMVGGKVPNDTLYKE